MEQLIHLDNMATTKMRPEVVEAMLSYFMEFYGNPSPVCDFSTNSKKAVSHAGETVTQSLGAKTDEICFTAGDSESNGWALAATAEAYVRKGKHTIISKIEYHAIPHTYQYPEEGGHDVTYLDMDENGIVKLSELKKAIKPDTILVFVMSANNEIGTIEPIKEIGAITKGHGVLFYTDVMQAYVHTPTNVDDYNIDMLSSNGHKLNGPKGIDFLCIRIGVKIHSFIHGRAQERKRRADTENAPGTVGCGKAVEIAMANMKERTRRKTELRDYLMERVVSEMPSARISDSRSSRLSNNADSAFQFIEGESLLTKLDMVGVCDSSGSAYTSGSSDPSHVLLATGLPHETAHGPLHLTPSEENTREEIDYVAEQIRGVVAYPRSVSPLYKDYMKHNKQ